MSKNSIDQLAHRGSVYSDDFVEKFIGCDSLLQRRRQEQAQASTGNWQTLVPCRPFSPDPYTDGANWTNDVIPHYIGPVSRELEAQRIANSAPGWDRILTNDPSLLLYPNSLRLDPTSAAKISVELRVPVTIPEDEPIHELPVDPKSRAEPRPIDWHVFTSSVLNVSAEARGLSSAGRMHNVIDRLQAYDNAKVEAREKECSAKYSKKKRQGSSRPPRIRFFKSLEKLE